MANHGKLAAIASKRGKTVKEAIADALGKKGSIYGAAVELGVTPNSIQFWMKRNGYRLELKRVARLVKSIPQKESRYDQQ